MQNALSSFGRIVAGIARKRTVTPESVSNLSMLNAWKQTDLHGQKKTIKILMFVAKEKEKEPILNGNLLLLKKTTRE